MTPETRRIANHRSACYLEGSRRTVGGFQDFVEVTPSDRELVLRVRNGDHDAFRLLYERWQPILYRLVLAQVRDGDHAHDIIQETFIRIWDHRGGVDPDRPLLGYAVRISSNLVRDAGRRRMVRERHGSALLSRAPSEGDDPEQAARLSMLQERLEEVIANDLPEKCRTVFILSRFEGKSTKEIAGLLGLSTKTVENHIGRALKVLRKKFKREQTA